MRYLLDSHAIMWATADDGRLSRRSRSIIRDPETSLVVSVASLWELTIKVMRGGLRLPEPLDSYFDGLIADFDFEVIPVHRHHVAALADLPDAGTDPFDRMLAAQALTDDLVLISRDAEMRGYPIEVLW